MTLEGHKQPVCDRLGGSTQQDSPRSPQGLLPPPRPFTSGLSHQPQPVRQAGTPQQFQQSVFSPSSSHRAVVQQPAGQNASQTPAGLLPLSNALGTDPGIQPQQSRAVANAWTPMKASNDLPRQALVNKVMKGKELPSNSLIGAGLDPTKSAPTPRSIKHFKSEFYQLLCRLLQGLHRASYVTCAC